MRPRIFIIVYQLIPITGFKISGERENTVVVADDIRLGSTLPRGELEKNFVESSEIDAVHRTRARGADLMDIRNNDAVCTVIYDRAYKRRVGRGRKRGRERRRQW